MSKVIRTFIILLVCAVPLAPVAVQASPVDIVKVEAGSEYQYLTDSIIEMFTAKVDFRTGFDNKTNAPYYDPAVNDLDLVFVDSEPDIFRTLTINIPAKALTQKGRVYSSEINPASSLISVTYEEDGQITKKVNPALTALVVKLKAVGRPLPKAQNDPGIPGLRFAGLYIVELSWAGAVIPTDAMPSSNPADGVIALGENPALHAAEVGEMVSGGAVPPGEIVGTAVPASLSAYYLPAAGVTPPDALQ
ncbi:MAG: hypothetical protein ACSLFH_05080 [Desulfuromonadales bacterium]